MRQLAYLATLIALLGSASVVSAQTRYSAAGPAGGFVTAESRFGHGTVSGPVRVSARGNREVRLPGGTWISCGRSCSETLRVESIDFWENKGAGRDRTDNACGLFGCLSRGFGF